MTGEGFGADFGTVLLCEQLCIEKKKDQKKERQKEEEEEEEESLTRARQIDRKSVV